MRPPFEALAPEQHQRRNEGLPRVVPPGPDRRREGRGKQLAWPVDDDALNGRVLRSPGSQRLLFTERRAAFDAKNRLSLPSTMPLEWGAFEAARRVSFDLASDVDALVKQVAKQDVDTAARAREWLAFKPRAAHELALLKTKLEARLAQPAEVSEPTPTDTKKEQAS